MTKKKDLSTYFDDWYRIDCVCDKKTTPEMEEFVAERSQWCSENLGSIKGLKWDTLRYAKPVKRGQMAGFIFTFRFKHEEAAMMFILRWGGSFVVTNQ